MKSLQVGSRLGPILIQAKQTNTWTGTVWKGVDTQQRSVLLQQVIREKMPWLTPRQWKQFQLQAEELPTLSHPALVSYRESINFDQEQYCLVVEDMSPTHSLPLQTWVEQQNPTSRKEENAWNIWQQIVAGVQSMHSRGWVHGTLSPTTILIRPGPEGFQARVGSLGLFYLVPQYSQIHPEIHEFQPYLAPETKRHQNLQDEPSTDIYALGAVLWFLLTSQPPTPEWKTETQYKQMSPIVQEALQQTLCADPRHRSQHCRPLRMLAQAQEKANPNALQTQHADPPTSNNSDWSSLPDFDTLPYSNADEQPEDDLYAQQFHSDMARLLSRSRRAHPEQLRQESKTDILPLSTTSELGTTLPNHPPIDTPTPLNPPPLELPQAGANARSMPQPIPLSWEQEALQEDMTSYQTSHFRTFLWIVWLIFMAFLLYSINAI